MALCASIEYTHAPPYACVGRATASQSGRLPHAAGYGARETRSYAQRVLRTTLKQTLMRSSSLNGCPAASRVSKTTWRKCFAGIVINPVGTSQRAKLRPCATVSQPAQLLLLRPSHTVWRCGRLRFTVDQSRDHQPLHDITAWKWLWDTAARRAHNRRTTRSSCMMDRTRCPYRYHRNSSVKSLIVLLFVQEYCLHYLFHPFKNRKTKSRFLRLTCVSPDAP